MEVVYETVDTGVLVTRQSWGAIDCPRGNLNAMQVRPEANNAMAVKLAQVVSESLQKYVREETE